MNIQNENLGKLRNERDSLLTAISLIVSDKKDLHTSLANSNAKPVNQSENNGQDPD